MTLDSIRPAGRSGSILPMADNLEVTEVARVCHFIEQLVVHFPRPLLGYTLVYRDDVVNVGWYKYFTHDGKYLSMKNFSDSSMMS